MVGAVSGTETDLARNAIAAIRLAFPRCIPIRVQSSGKGRVKVRNGWMQLAPGGTPDWLIVLPERGSVWIEFKQPGEEPTDKQLEMHAKLQLLGQTVYVVDEVAEAVAAVRCAVEVAKARKGAA